MSRKPQTKHNSQLFSELSDDEKSFVREFAVHEKMGREDPVYFAEYHLGLTLHDGQKEFLRFSDPTWIALHPAEVAEYNRTHKNQIMTGHKNLLNPSNRWGKTVVLAVKHIRYNYYKIGIDAAPSEWEAQRYQTLGLSPHSSQLDACFNYILDILHSRFLGVPYGPNGKPDPDLPARRNDCKIDFYLSHNSQKRQITFKSNSTFYAAPTGEDAASSIAGKPFGYISYDEVVLSHHLREELFGRIFSRTMDWNAPVDLVSTADDQAKSQQYYFHLVRNADKGENEWYAKHGILDDNTFIEVKKREDSKAKLLAEDPLRYRQVVLGEFIPSSTKSFDITTIENMWSKQIPDPIRKDIPNPTDSRHIYVGSVDWGFADTGDPTIMGFFDTSVEPYQLIYCLKIQGGNPMSCLGTLRFLWQHYGLCDIIMDTNSMGGVMIKKMLKEMGIRTYDFSSHNGEKEDGIFKLKLLLSKGRQPALENNQIIEKNPNYGGLRSYYISDMEDELASYELEDKKLKQDYVMMLMMFAWFMDKRTKSLEGTKTFVIANRTVRQI